MNLFEKQKCPLSYHSGSELLELCFEEMRSPKERTAGKIKELYARGKNQDSLSTRQPRLLILGNVIDRSNLFHLIERAGGSIVVFDHCTGLRHYEEPVIRDEEPMKSLARRYLLKPLCYQAAGYEKRLDRIKRIIKEYSINGVIYCSMRCCDYGLFEMPIIERSLKDSSIPFLFLENDYTRENEGQVRTRVEAFLETLN